MLGSGFVVMANKFVAKNPETVSIVVVMAISAIMIIVPAIQADNICPFFSSTIQNP